MTPRTHIRLAVWCSIGAVVGTLGRLQGPAAVVDPNQDVAASRIVRVISHDGDAGATECLGFRYSSDWVLTAAHCVPSVDSVEVVTSSGSRHLVTRVEEHAAMDLSALRAPTSARVDTAEIVSASDEPGTTLVVSKLEGRDAATTLMQGRAVAYHVTPEAVRVRSETRPCRGDSGGPLLTPHGAILGVLSRGSIACDGRDEYVLLAPIARWLHATTAPEPDSPASD